MPSFARSAMESSVMSAPSKTMLPLVGRSMPMISLASVDLPPPLGPVITVKRSLGMESDRSSMMRFVSFDPSCTGTSNTRFFSSNMMCSLRLSRHLTLYYYHLSKGESRPRSRETGMEADFAGVRLPKALGL